MHKTSCFSTCMSVISLIFQFWTFGKWIVLCRFRGLSLFLPTLRLQVSRTYDCSGLQLPQSLDCLHLLVCFSLHVISSPVQCASSSQLNLVSRVFHLSTPKGAREERMKDPGNEVALNSAVSQLLLDAIKRFLNLSPINSYSYFVIIFEIFNSLFFTYAQRFA